MAPITLFQATIQTRTTSALTKTVTERIGGSKTVYPPCETCAKTNHSTEKCYYGVNAANRVPPRHRRPERQKQVQEGANQNDSKEVAHTAA